MECFNMTKLPGFDVGGIVHLIINNQLGFTTPSELGRSSPYASDIGKMIGCPVIRVNGDEPEQLLKAAEIAAKYRHEYKKDIIIDMLCYRKWGHNELDDPTFTQPLMYRDIHGRQSVPDKYTDKLIEAGIVDKNTVDQWIENSMAHWNSLLKKCDNYVPEPIYLAPDSPWGKMSLPNVNHVTTWDTGCHGDELRYIGAKSVEVHEDFAMHEHLTKSHAEARVEKLQTDSLVDWALAEAFAFGSLLNQGYDIRLCGEDVGRGTFSHRHAVFTCQQSGNYHIPLNHMLEDQKAQIEVVCSLLSEEAVTGFEYGMSIENPDRLVIWEAQFGDFFTGAQIIFDTFITSGEAKWMYQSGLVVLLPHGYDGAGPEHSSCRIERFLQGTNSSEDSIDGDGVNISVCHPTTSAQYFHLLRRQMVRNFRKPLIVVSPKILLRLPAAMSHMKDFQPGTHFLPVIGDSSVKEPQRVKKVVLCSGKHCYALEKERSKLIKTEVINQSDVAIVKLEELCPFPAAELQRELSKYQSAEAYVWSQEEPRNMGPWTFVSPRFENLLGVKLKFAGRRESAAPAVGIGGLHRQEVEKLMKETFA
ncbi:unnamed protein product [Clavelina lepadiformis]|uniref:2-oxoadipate dehydrogenase complex component E1 n=1 Tax=Clavelina lepadiformis TaxID=159417 RepID=A0ABP0F4I2_CLALP